MPNTEVLLRIARVPQLAALQQDSLQQVSVLVLFKRHAMMIFNVCITSKHSALSKQLDQSLAHSVLPAMHTRWCLRR
jgi:hypothetical protein